MMLVKPFGPQIGLTKLSEDHNDKLLELCYSLENDLSRRMNQNLAGLIEKEFSILDLIPEEILGSLTLMVIEYLNTSINNWEQYRPFSFREITCTEAWCNIQKENEFNPLHSHPLHEVVMVIFPKVNLSTDEIKNSSDVCPGALNFQFGHQVSNFGNQKYSIVPKTGDVVIFPADLLHYTYPYFNKSDERISISLNFVINDNFYRLRRIKNYRS